MNPMTSFSGGGDDLDKPRIENGKVALGKVEHLVLVHGDEPVNVLERIVDQAQRPEQYNV